MHLRTPLKLILNGINGHATRYYEPQKVLEKRLIDILMGYSIVLMNQFVWAYILRRLQLFFYNNFMADVRLIVRSDVLRRKVKYHSLIVLLYV